MKERALFGILRPQGSLINTESTKGLPPTLFAVHLEVRMLILVDHYALLFSW